MDHKQRLTYDEALETVLGLTTRELHAVRDLLDLATSKDVLLGMLNGILVVREEDERRHSTKETW